MHELAQISESPEVDVRKRRNTRIKAILAGGLVLGLGAAVTLAAWNDSEFASGSFAAGHFNLEGSSTNGTTFTEHASAGAAAALSFTVNPTNMQPGSIVYAPFAVRLDSTTTYDATVTITNAATTGSLTGLTYRLVQPTAWGCSSSTTGTTLVPAATAIGTVPGSTTFDLTQGAGVAGAPAYLCFVVTADAALVQGQTGTVTWDFTAASKP